MGELEFAQDHRKYYAHYLNICENFIIERDYSQLVVSICITLNDRENWLNTNVFH